MYPKINSLEQGLSDEVAATPGILNMAGNNSGCDGVLKLDELLREAMYSSSGKEVAPFGILELRENVAQKISKLYGHVYSPENEITITSGSNQAFFSAISAFVGEGDEVIIFEPADESYLPSILLNGGKPVYISLKDPDFHIDWEEVMQMVNGNTRMIIINTPHNPTGMLLTELDMLRLQKIINGTRIIVLSDESFEHIIFDGLSHQSVSLYPKLSEKSILVNSFSYTCQVPGWNVGYCAGPVSLMVEIRKVLKVMGNNVYIPFQLALAAYISNRENYDKLGKFYQEKRDYFTVLMESLTRFVALPTYGTFFQLYSYKTINEERDMAVVQKLISKHGVGTAPISLFFHEKSKKPLLRFNFAQPAKVLAQIVERLQSF